MSLKVSQNFAVFVPEKMSFVQANNNPWKSQDGPDKYGMYEHIL